MPFELSIDPIVPLWVAGAIGAALLAALLLGLVVRGRGLVWRAIAAAALVALLLDPSLVEETRRTLPDVVAVVVDRSPSQAMGQRSTDTDRVLAALKSRLDTLENIDVRIREAGRSGEGAGLAAGNEGTRLFGPAREMLGDVSPGQIGAVIFITDGQIHDIPASLEAMGTDAPIHALITGRRDERDRRITVVTAPRYGMVGEEATVEVRVDDVGMASNGAEAFAEIVMHVDGELVIQVAAPVGTTVPLAYQVAHGGSNVVEIETAPIADEITTLNNRAVIVTQGIRDRLRVLLVSGEPHAGERTWRNLLKADPSVDLVHFTILRPPEKQDGTPIGELSLIAFPTRELFSEKLEEFDLIVFDRYQQRGVLPVLYLGNIARYVETGGAVLVVAGPDFASAQSLYRTPLAAVLPARPTGRIIEDGFRPRVTADGLRHPVATGLPGGNFPGLDGAMVDPSWGRWFRFIDSDAVSGEAVLDGPNGRPLLLLDRVGEGRVAQLMSDHAWLWTRGFEGGGPQSELLRRLAHWLMKEPDLEEERLSAETDGGRILIERRSMGTSVPPVAVTLPDGTETTLTLGSAEPGLWRGAIDADQLGLYRFNDGILQTVAAIGPVNALEYTDVQATDTHLIPLVTAARSGTYWPVAGPRAVGSIVVPPDVPALRNTSAGQDQAGRSWAGIRRNERYVVEASRSVPLAPPLLSLALILAASLLAWRAEGR